MEKQEKKRNIGKNIFKDNRMIVLGIILVLFISLLILVFLNKESIVKIAKKVFNLNTKDIVCELYSNEDDILKYLITVIDEENGIQEIEYPNGDKQECNGKIKVGIDFVVESNGTYVFKTVSTTGEIMTKQITIDDDYRENQIIPIEVLEQISTERNYRVDYNYLNIEFDCYYAIGENNEDWIKVDNNVVINVDAYDAYHKERLNEDGTITLKLKKEDKFGNKVEIKYKENYNVTEDFYQNGEEDLIIEGKSLIHCIRDNDDIKSGNYTLRINGEDYPAEIYVYDENVKYITNKNLGTIENDSRMLIMKYKGNLTVEENNIITAQARKKGMFICVEGELVNNGEISMTSRGAKAEGQNVYLWEHKNGVYEYVPAIGANGGEAVSSKNGSNGKSGYDAIGRQTRRRRIRRFKI